MRWQGTGRHTPADYRLIPKWQKPYILTLIYEEYVNRAYIFLFNVISAQLNNPTSIFAVFSYTT